MSVAVEQRNDVGLFYVKEIEGETKRSVDSLLQYRHEKIYAQLTHKFLSQEKSLWINTSANGNEERYFKPLIYSLLYFFYNKNINLDKKSDTPRIGDLYQKGKVQCKVMETNIKLGSANDAFIKVRYSEKKARTSKEYTVTLSESDFYREYVRIGFNDGPRVGTKTDIRPLLQLMEKLTGQARQIVTFPKKFAVICSKKHFEESFESKEVKTFPYEYVTKNETTKVNFQFDDVQFFVAPDYETIQDHVIDKGIPLECVVIIGNHKFNGLDNDILRGNVQHAMFVSYSRPEIENYLTWSWTHEEAVYLAPDATFKTNEIVNVRNELFEYSVRDFFDEISKLENKYGVNLREVNKHISDLFGFVPPSDCIEVDNILEKMRQSFLRQIDSILSSELSFVGVEYQPVKENLVSLYDLAINEIVFNNNAKANVVGHIEGIEDPDNVLIPIGQKVELWKEAFSYYSQGGCFTWILKSKSNGGLIEALEENVKTQAINLRKFKWLERQTKVMVFGIENIEFFKLVYGSIHNIIWVLYSDEFEKYKKYKKDYDTAARKELTSEDRQELIGIKHSLNFVDRDKHYDSVKTSSTIDKLFDYEVKESIYSYTNRYEQTPKRIIYTNDSRSDLYSDTQVVLIENDDQVLCSVSDLIEGDRVRVYEAQSREILESILVQHDKFAEILKNSLLWKENLSNFLAPLNRIQYYEQLSKLSRIFEVSVSTVEGWLKEDSQTKFPQKVEGLESLGLFSSQEFENIVISSKKYKSYTIHLGRDFSSELRAYLMFGKKGDILREFDASFVDKITELNMPVRIVRSIVDREESLVV